LQSRIMQKLFSNVTGELNVKKKTDKKDMTLMGLSLYGIIMLSLSLIYKDLLITITCMTIMLVMIVQYIIPIRREKKKRKAEEPVAD
jgi:hypothetical protein